MYLILTPYSQSSFGMTISSSELNYLPISYNAIFSQDIDLVAKMLKKKDVVVYRLDSLTKITDVEVTYKEITPETT